MTNDQINMVQSSFRKVLPLADSTAAIFYKRLFELEPRLQLLFKEDMVKQGNKLMQALGLAVVSLQRFEQILPTLRTLGARHVGYGVRDEDYDTVGSALLWTLGQTLGEAFTAELEAAWGEAYANISAEMKAGAVTCPLPQLDAYACRG